MCGGKDLAVSAAPSDVVQIFFIIDEIGRPIIVCHIFLNQNVLNILGSSENFSKYIMEFENQLNDKPSFITPTFDMNNEKTVAIMFYMKDLDSVNLPSYL